MSQKMNRLLLPELESVDYYYDSNKLKFKAYQRSYPWMNDSTTSIYVVECKARYTGEQIYEINIRYEHKNPYGRPGYYEAFKQYHWYQNGLYRRGAKIKTIPKEIKETLKILKLL